MMSMLWHALATSGKKYFVYNYDMYIVVYSIRKIMMYLFG